jgi:RNase P subunit RPR2
VKCPVCGSINFFVKDPADEYETYDFELKGDSVVFNPGAADLGLEIKPDTEVFCERCSWHDRFQELKKS